ncbi:MAG: hypothetical protein FWE11_05935 [Defluviitaleaceae bacterium]|nr:hypothetical protein [Defluviitaleaceae bacterium]
MIVNRVALFDGIAPSFGELIGSKKITDCVQQYDDISKLVGNLDWNMPKCEQEKAIGKILNTVNEDDYDLLILLGNKNSWLNIVKIIEAMGYPKNKKALPSLILLLQDLNWPGANEGIGILKNIEHEVLVPMLEAAIESAAMSCDYMWLAGIKQFLRLAHITKQKFINQDLFEELKNADW